VDCASLCFVVFRGRVLVLSDADAEVDFPERRHVEIGHREDLLLLREGGEVADGPIVGVVLDARTGTA
jgi:hypothetical protein